MTDYYKDIEYEVKPREKYGPRFTAEQCFEYRDRNQCSIMKAKDDLMREQMLEDLAKGRCGLDTSLLYDILEYMLENRYV